MPTGHLTLGLLGGLLGFAAALWMGQPVWVALLLYTGLGNLVLVASVLVELVLSREPPPPRRVARRVQTRRVVARRVFVTHPVRVPQPAPVRARP